MTPYAAINTGKREARFNAYRARESINKRAHAHVVGR